MAITINGKTYRNLQEQVEENVKDIEDLQDNQFSGSYNDLTDKPDLTVYETKAEAFSGDYDDLIDKPDLSVYELAENAFSGVYDDLTDKPNLATVATSGAYSDLSGTPTIPPTVSGTNNGGNWTSLTIGSDTYNIPQAAGMSAGTGIDINNAVISVDNTVALKTDLPNAVSGTNDGTNWTALTVGSDTYNIPQPMSAGTGISISNNTISVDNTIAAKSDIVTYNHYTVRLNFNGNYNSLTNVTIDIDIILPDNCPYGSTSGTNYIGSSKIAVGQYVYNRYEYSLCRFTATKAGGGYLYGLGQVQFDSGGYPHARLYGFDSNTVIQFTLTESDMDLDQIRVTIHNL